LKIKESFIGKAAKFMQLLKRVWPKAALLFPPK